MKSRINWVAIWFFPIVAIGVTGWIFYDAYQNKGPIIKIVFNDASGIQPQKTQIRFRGVPIGYVQSVEISEYTKKVIALVHLQKDAQSFSKEGSKFWIISPKVTFSGISGLDTIIEGTYIEAHPGKPTNETKLEFTGTLSVDNTEASETMSVYFLETPNVESIGTGDAISYRGFNIGYVSKVNLNKTAQLAIIQINIQNQYAKLIRQNTQFWRKVAVQADLGLFGSKIKVNSLESLMKGGIEFHTPEPPDKKAKNASYFPLNPSAPKGYEKWNPALE